MPSTHIKAVAAAALLALAGCQGGGVEQTLDASGGQAAGATGGQQEVAAAEPDGKRITQAQLRGYCPAVTLREDTGFFTTYTKGKDKVPDEAVYQASISDVTRSCLQENGTLTMKVAAAGRVVPGPKGKNGTITMPVRVAVVEGDKVLYSNLSKHQVQIDTSAGAAQFVVSDENISVPISEGSRFKVLVGFDEGPYNTP